VPLSASPTPGQEDGQVILELNAGSSAWVRGIAALVLSLHITAGIAGITFGAMALAVRKGARLHRELGNWFFGSMLTMATIGAFVSPFLPTPSWGNVIGGLFTLYLVTTAWMTVRRKEGSVGAFEVGALLAALGLAGASVALGLRAAYGPAGAADAPLPAYFIIGGVALLAATGDLALVLRRGVSGGRRIARHLWRMCFALFFAAGSLFLGQQQVFPIVLRGSPLLFVPEIAILGLMIFWLIRVRFTNRFKTGTVDRRSLQPRSRRAGPAEGTA
jgi:uncharacterized membrane protein